MWSLVLAAVAVLPPAAGSAFFASLHSHYVVNLDFEPSPPRGPSRPDGEGDHEHTPSDDVHTIAFAGGKQKFKCHLPTGREPADIHSKDAVKPQQHFIKAKMAEYHGNCWKTKMNKEDYWTYAVCPGNKVTQYRDQRTPGAEEQRFSLGDHDDKSDVLRADGGVTEHYLGGTDNRSTTIWFVCGSSDAKKRLLKVEESKPLVYNITMSGPSFCVWKDESGSRTTTPDGERMLVSAFLEDLRDSCMNLTLGWWTYEYCFPKGITQFHGGKNGEREPEYSLGSIVGTGTATEADKVDMSIVRRRQKTSPSRHRVLQQRLEGGTKCDETQRPRATKVSFQCPVEWSHRLKTHIVSVEETSLCEYEVVVHTKLLCGHYKFLPALPRAEEAIQCVAETEGL